MFYFCSIICKCDRKKVMLCLSCDEWKCNIDWRRVLFVYNFLYNIVYCDDFVDFFIYKVCFIEGYEVCG